MEVVSLIKGPRPQNCLGLTGQFCHAQFCISPCKARKPTESFVQRAKVKERDREAPGLEEAMSAWWSVMEGKRAGPGRQPIS